MHLSISEGLPLPVDEVFHLLRDDMPALVPYLHDVERIVVLERVEQGDTVRLVNLWQGSLAKVPGPARPFVTAELLSWNDHASWSTAKRQATWRLEPRVGGRIFTCEGTTTVQPDPTDAGRSRLALEVELEVYPERVPGVPSLLARKLRGPIEQTIAGQVRPNLEHLAASIRAYAAAKC